MAWVEIGIGVASTAVGLINEGKANKKADELSSRRPRRQQSQYIKDDIALSESELVNPMSAAADRAYTTQADKEFATSIGAINRGGGSVNNVGDVFARGEEGRTRLAILKDQARVSRVNNVLRSYQMANEEDQADFAFNEVAPWKDAAAANAQKKSVADSMVFGGISTAATGYQSFREGKNRDNAYEKYFGKPTRTDASGLTRRPMEETVNSGSRYTPSTPQYLTKDALIFEQGFTPDDMYNDPNTNDIQQF